ncbi:MAG: hypothetical protein ACRCYV_06910 [Aeromonas sp.]
MPQQESLTPQEMAFLHWLRQQGGRLTFNELLARGAWRQLDGDLDRVKCAIRKFARLHLVRTILRSGSGNYRCKRTQRIIVTHPEQEGLIQRASAAREVC